MNKSVYEILKELESTNSKNEKESILNLHKDNIILKRCFEMAYSPTVRFYIKKIDDVPNFDKALGTLESGLTLLSKLSNREITGNDAISYLGQLLYTTKVEDREVLKRVVLKDLRCGVNSSTINKVWKGLIVTPPRQGAASMNEKSLAKLHKIKNLAIELKSDGSYAASICGEVTTMMSRNGNPLDIECLQTHLSCGAFDGFALEGELVYSLDKATREQGNGIITKIVKNTASDEEKDNAQYQVWDCIDTKYYEYKGEYPFSNKQRRELLEIMMDEYHSWCEDNNLEPKIHPIPRCENVSVDRVFEIFEQYVRDGYEGAIAKDMDVSWKDIAKPTYCIKVKRKEPADLKVVGWYKGDKGTKYGDYLGGLICESECGEIKVNVGSGFSDEQRMSMFKELPPIIEVEYDSVTEDKKTNQKSLFLPIFKRERFDKSVADTYKQVLDKQRIK